MKAIAAAAGTLLGGCDRIRQALSLPATITSESQEAIATASEVDDFLRRMPLPPRYRHVQPRLFQGVPTRDMPSRVRDGSPMLWDRYGPTATFVDTHTGWPWTRPGGDWVDARGQRHGLEPWLSAAVGDSAGPDGAVHCFADATRLVQHAQSEQRWLALLLRSRTAVQTIAGPQDPAHNGPVVDVVYADGERARLRCLMVAASDPSSSLPVTTSVQVKMPVFVEFERPTKAVSTATLRFSATVHGDGGGASMVDGFLLDPPLDAARPREGLARETGPLDQGLGKHPSVIGVHRYLDGTTLADFVHADKVSFSSEHRFDPAIFGTGKSDTSKYPHAGQGKWINDQTHWALVPSTYVGDGFAPLAPTVGALRIHMPSTPGLVDGGVTNSGGTLAANAMIFLPEPLFGRLDRIFVRYYVRLGLPHQPEPRRRLQIRQSAGSPPVWADMGGKFGIGPDHSSTLGGVSGSSGGGAGWQMRLSWGECDAAMGGPDERGWSPGFHLYDFQGNNPAGHRYGGERPPEFGLWGQRGGAGGMLYAGHWYCIETELKLNSASERTGTFGQDGELRAWVDGRLVYEQVGMVFRTLPISDVPYHPSRMRPCRELGVKGLWLNWFHGGQTPSTVDRVLFYTGLAWGKDYIGPMSM